MKWLHRTDEQSKKFGHSLHNMTVHAFLMTAELESLMSSWKTHQGFSKFIKLTDTLTKDEKDTTMSQAEAFFVTYKIYHMKHFQQWWWTILLPFAIASVDPCAQVFVQ
jgi:hypothetical protein